MPAGTGWIVCRFHGARGGGQKGAVAPRAVGDPPHRLPQIAPFGTMLSTMHARNDVTIRGVDLAEALRRILPRTKSGELGTVVIRPGPEPNTLRLDAYYAGTPVAAEGAWVDEVEVNARMLLGFMVEKRPATFRLVFFEGRLAVNGSTIPASLAPPDPIRVTAPKVWSKRRKMPHVGRGLKRTRLPLP
jgi:hypothetical protein